MTPEEEAKMQAEKAEAQEIERISKTAKRFAENARILIGEGHIVFVLYTGESSEVFALTPHHAKRLSQLLSFQISQYERQNGEIPAMLDLRIPSPFQAELQGPRDSEEPPEAGKNPPTDKPKGKK